MSFFSIYGLKENFEMAQLMQFTNLQWSRRYHEAGDFSIQLPVEWYNPQVKYIYTKSRPELGKIASRRYTEEGNHGFIQLSGYFLEKELDRMICYEPGSSNITGGPTWQHQQGTAEDVATAFFRAFSSITYTMTGKAKKTANLGITASNSRRRGQTADHFRNGEELGYKIYWILKPSGMSYRVNYDFLTNEKKFECIQGLNRTLGNPERNNPVCFSTRNGTIQNPDFIVNEKDYKNAFISVNENTKNDYKTFTVQAGDDGSAELNFMRVQVSENPEEYQASQYKQILEIEGLNELENKPVIVNLDFKINPMGYEYLKDYDLGDLVDFTIPELGIEEQRRIIACYEVIKNNEWTLEVELGQEIGG